MFDGASAIVTGAGQGIGRALAHQLASRNVRVLVNDLNEDAAHRVAKEVGGAAHAGDLRDPAQVAAMVARAEDVFGQVDMLFSNAGFALGEPDGPTSQPDAHWQDSWDLHVMAHLRAARLLVPGMAERKSGVLVNVASAAGLLSQIGDAAYSATKHAAVSVAQSLAIEHADDGIQVSVVCPLYVATPLLGYSDEGGADCPPGVLSADEVAKAVLDGVSAGDFMIYPHPEAKTFFERRASDTDRWIDGMTALRRRVRATAEGTDPAAIHRHI